MMKSTVSTANVGSRRKENEGSVGMEVTVRTIWATTTSIEPTAL
jgi:hypothetical protein